MITFFPNRVSNRAKILAFIAGVVIVFAVFCFGFFAGMNTNRTFVPTTRLLTRDEIKALPDGTKVWVEYNHDRLDLWDDEAMFRQDKDGVGPVLRNNSGYWEIDDYRFGNSFRVWEKMPSERESRSTAWSDSPW